MQFQYQNAHYHFTRYPATSNRSLRAWSAADEHILKHLDEQQLTQKSILIANDRFGFLMSCLHPLKPTAIVAYKSQQKSWQKNFIANGLKMDESRVFLPLEGIDQSFELALLKIPKSLELFRLYLYQLSKQLEEGGIVICGFMTRHFSPQIINIAKDFFEKAEQSKAWKKSRLLILTKKKAFQEISLLNIIGLASGGNLQQYFGVFSSGHIDYGTQFLIQHLSLREEDHRVLDLACGNGVLANTIRQHKAAAELHLLDDAFLAIASSKLNLSADNTYFHFEDNLEKFEDNYFDFVVSNPPFHFAYENNIEVSLRLFREVKRCLKMDGHFQLVANKHLNYKVHLEKIFDPVNVVAENEKFVVYDCLKE